MLETRVTMGIAGAMLLAMPLAMLLALGCGRGSAERQASADSTAAATLRASAESVSIVPGVWSDSSSTRSGARPGTIRPAPHIGYDSAFGPSFTVDSTGKVTAIRKKKP